MLGWKLLLYLVMAGAIAAITGTPFVVALVALGIIFALSGLIFAYQSGSKLTTEQAWDYVGYVHSKAVLAVLRIIFPGAGWYLITSAGFNTVKRITGPYASTRQISLQMMNATASARTAMSVEGKFCYRTPEGALKPTDDIFLIGYP